ncbi:MAG TPA: GNAT family N-acetyltransferase [Candidatus Sulfopaludibacter sp.]|nr:GNAT family N-acetyltransferase [Candidatus Sulfopaludibacter sp.]
METPRLKLRGHGVDDFPACAALWGDSRVTRYIGGKPQTPEEAWARLLRYVGHWQLMGYGFWAIEEKASGKFVGELGFADFKRDIQPAIDVPEAGWVVATAAHGFGYATEALQAALQWFGQPTACIMHPENSASRRVAEKCGYGNAEMVTYRGQPTILMRR